MTDPKDPDEIEPPIRVPFNTAKPVVTIEGERFLGMARLRQEGEETRFDEGTTFGNHRPRGEGQTMRDSDLVNVWFQPEERQESWYVVRDAICSYDIDDEEACVWTLSRTPGETGWETDGGYGGYGLKYSDARELADAANKSIIPPSK